jgi:hypothetical protein
MNDVERLQPVTGIPYRDLSLVIRPLSSSDLTESPDNFGILTLNLTGDVPKRREL